MNCIRQNSITTFFSALLALLVLNLSVDPPDLIQSWDEKYGSVENLTINEVESIYEFLLEKCFDMENAVPEADEQDNSFAHALQYYLRLTPQDAFLCKSLILATLKSNVIFSESFVHAYALKIHSPPPELS